MDGSGPCPRKRRGLVDSFDLEPPTHLSSSSFTSGLIDWSNHATPSLVNISRGPSSHVDLASTSRGFPIYHSTRPTAGFNVPREKASSPLRDNRSVRGGHNLDLINMDVISDDESLPDSTTIPRTGSTAVGGLPREFCSCIVFDHNLPRAMRTHGSSLLHASSVNSRSFSSSPFSLPSGTSYPAAREYITVHDDDEQEEEVPLPFPSHACPNVSPSPSGGGSGPVLRNEFSPSYRTSAIANQRAITTGVEDEVVGIGTTSSPSSSRGLPARRAYHIPSSPIPERLIPDSIPQMRPRRPAPPPPLYSSPFRVPRRMREEFAFQDSSRSRGQSLSSSLDVPHTVVMATSGLPFFHSSVLSGHSSPRRERVPYRHYTLRPPYPPMPSSSHQPSAVPSSTDPLRDHLRELQEMEDAQLARRLQLSELGIGGSSGTYRPVPDLSFPSLHLSHHHPAFQASRSSVSSPSTLQGSLSRIQNMIDEFNHHFARTDTVSIGVTPQELDAHSSVELLDAVSNRQFLNEKNACCICLSEFEATETIRTIHCHHIYHKECIDRWFQSSVSCPMCKGDIRRMTTASSTTSG